MIVSIIVAVGTNFEIGCHNKLLWHLPKDLKNFKEITKGHHMVMGRKTFESIGKPLPGRTSIILTRDKNYKQAGCDIVHDLDHAVLLAEERGEEELFIIGGEEVYRQFMPITDRLYLTKVDWEGEADAFFPTVKMDEWDILKREFHPKEEGNPLSWEFLLLLKK